MTTWYITFLSMLVTVHFISPYIDEAIPLVLSEGFISVFTEAVILPYIYREIKKGIVAPSIIKTIPSYTYVHDSSFQTAPKSRRGVPTKASS